ncbi:hypothetical protein ACFPOE_23920 [Caenimonas terrae]|uniref:Lipocalin-like domain-containing protein n=1 Tax=Caenimonas terrae TaxID=696074 RepID=A0ABW0NJ34_9BURK
MKRILIRACVFLLSAFSLVGMAQAQETDSALAKRLLGQWQELRILDCEGYQQVMSLNANGSFEVKGILRACDGNTPFTWRGNWEVQGGKLHYVTTFSDPVRVYPIGESFEDEILSVSESEWVMREQSTGNKSIAYRVR